MESVFQNPPADRVRCTRSGSTGTWGQCFSTHLQVESDVPGQGVLVHGVDVGQLGDAEEQRARVHGDGAVPDSGLVNLPLRDRGHRLFGRYLLRQHLAADGRTAEPGRWESPVEWVQSRMYQVSVGTGLSQYC